MKDFAYDAGVKIIYSISAAVLCTTVFRIKLYTSLKWVVPILVKRNLSCKFG